MMSISTTLLRAKREWMPPNWDKILVDLKKEGKDIKSTDINLAKLGHEQAKDDTGKYLMQEDILWCRSRSSFSEKSLIKWHKMFKNECDDKSGKISPIGLANLFKFGFPFVESESLIPTMTEICFKSSDLMDFKKAIQFLDCVNCKTLKDKLKWATAVVSGGKQRSIQASQLEHLVTLMDLVERNGFVNGPTEDELNDFLYRRPEEPLLDAEERIRRIMTETNVIKSDSFIEYDLIINLPKRIIYARNIAFSRF